MLYFLTLNDFLSNWRDQLLKKINFNYVQMITKSTIQPVTNNRTWQVCGATNPMRVSMRVRCFRWVEIWLFGRL